jgi:hypothetical protein
MLLLCRRWHDGNPRTQTENKPSRYLERPSWDKMRMTPTAFKSAMNRHSVTSGLIAKQCGVSGALIGQSLRWQRQPTREMRLGLLHTICERRDERYRSSRRDRAAALWKTIESVRRAQVERIATLLDDADEAWLADWLLRARPDRLGEVAAGVAVHALLRGFTEVWDGLIEPIEIMDLDLGCDWFDSVRGLFIWAPPSEWLLP